MLQVEDDDNFFKFPSSGGWLMNDEIIQPFLHIYMDVYQAVCAVIIIPIKSFVIFSIYTFYGA